MAKLVKGIIKKNGVDYNFTFNEEESAQTELMHAYAFLQKVAQGKDFWATQYEILDLGSGTDYEAIKVWYEHMPEVAAPTGDEAQPLEEFFNSRAVKVNYLGNDLLVNGLEAYCKGQSYYLPMEVNEQPALEVIDGAKLGPILSNALPGYQVIVPHAQLPDWEEAEAFIKDQADEVQKEKEAAQENPNKNAKAWEGWNEKE